MRLLGAISAQTCVTLKLPANCRFVDADLVCNGALRQTSFLQCINLVTLTLSEAVIGLHSCSFTFDGEKHLGIAASRIIPWVKLHWRVESAVCRRGYIIETKPLTRKLGAFVALSDVELSVLDVLHKRRRTFVAGRDLVHQEQTDQAAYILISGWACSYKLLADGQRQIIDFQIPGDFLGFRSVALHISDHAIEPVTDIEVTEVHVSDLMKAFADTPRLATAVFWAASRDEAMVVEHLVNIGRRDAAQRTAHFLLELGVRLSLVGMGSKAGYACPLSQYLIADALGLSAVHVNRVLRTLRESGMVTFRDGFVTYDDYDSLVGFADFEPTYLDQIGPLLASVSHPLAVPSKPAPRRLQA